MRFRYLVAAVVMSSVLTIAHGADGDVDEPEWLAPAIGPFTPSAHFNGAIGSSSSDPEELALGHHDPTREDGTVQGIEAGLSLRAGWLEGYAVYTISYGAEEEWETGWEEAFLKVKDIPGGFEVRGGRTLSRFGQHNAKHLHSWDFVDMPLVWGTFLGDDGLITDGGDVTWLKQGIGTAYGITVGYGNVQAHAHDHGHDDHDEDMHDEDMDHDHEDDHDEPHGHGVSFTDGVGSGRAFTQFRRDDFNAFETGASLALGQDEDDRDVVVAGIDFAYTWRENGLEPGGRGVKWLTEVLYRSTEDGDAHHDEHDNHDDDQDEHETEMLDGGSEWGFYSQGVYTHHQHLDAGLRLGYIAGDDSLGSHDRVRVSPAITAYLDKSRRTLLRLQYNYDDLQDGGEEHSAWLQLGMSWGGSEVR